MHAQKTTAPLRSLRVGGALFLLISVLFMGVLAGCAQSESEQAEETIAVTEFDDTAAHDLESSTPPAPAAEANTPTPAEQPKPVESTPAPTTPAADDALLNALGLTQDLRTIFDHGPKPAANQKYIVLHDTEGDGDAATTIDWWESQGKYISSHFVVNKDGSIYQVVPIDRIAHHAGYGDTGHNAAFGIAEDGRDDLRGASPIGDWAADYGMNGWSVGIELVHVGGSGDYPAAQLAALDQLIAAIDAHYGFESTIIDHKAWRTGNSDTSLEFAPYLANYQTTRNHLGVAR